MLILELPELSQTERCLGRYCSSDIAQNIYGSISGASYDPNQGLWIVPCDAEVDMALQFGYGNECFYFVIRANTLTGLTFSLSILLTLSYPPPPPQTLLASARSFLSLSPSATVNCKFSCVNLKRLY